MKNIKKLSFAFLALFLTSAFSMNQASANPTEAILNQVEDNESGANYGIDEGNALESDAWEEDNIYDVDPDAFVLINVQVDMPLIKLYGGNYEINLTPLEQPALGGSASGTLEFNTTSILRVIEASDVKHKVDASVTLRTSKFITYTYTYNNGSPKLVTEKCTDVFNLENTYTGSKIRNKGQDKVIIDNLTLVNSTEPGIKGKKSCVPYHLDPKLTIIKTEEK